MLVYLDAVRVHVVFFVFETLTSFKLAIITILSMNLTGCMIENDKSISLWINVDETALISGDIVLVSEIHNNAEKDVVFLPWNTPFDTSVNADFLSIVGSPDSQPKVLDYRGRVVKRRAPIADDYVELDVGESKIRRLTITNSYLFCSDTDYMLEFTGVFYSLDREVVAVETKALRFQTSNAFDVCD